jgi:hypothetical protein
VNAFTGGLGPAGKTAGAIPDLLFAKIYLLDLGAGLPHAQGEMTQHECCFALAFASRT